MSYQVYVSLRNDECIRRFALDPRSGGLEKKGEYEAKGGPGPMCLSLDGRTIHVGYRGHWRKGSDDRKLAEHGVSSFAIDARSGDLRPIGRVHTEGGPSYVCPDHTGRFLLSSYFNAGHCASHRIDASGAVSGPPIEWLATNPGAHTLQIDPSNRFVFVLHIGLGNNSLLEGERAANAIFQYRFDAQNGRLTPNDPLRVGPGDEHQWGPCHACWHPTQPWLFVVNEQGNNISLYTLDRERGTLTLGDTVSTLPPEGYTPKAGGRYRTVTADIQMHVSGRFLYAPNRGHNSIASFQVDQASGNLTPTGWARADADPKAFMLDPSGHYLLCTGNKTGRLTVYRIDQQDGTLSELESVMCGSVPSAVLITD